MIVRRHGTAGQSSVELMALLPLLVVVALTVAQLLAAGVAHELAGHAAENGAIALGQGEDPEAAVREALPGWAAERVAVKVRGRQVQVRLEPVTILPGVGPALMADARADAGPVAGAHGGSPAAAPLATGSGLGAARYPTRDDPTARGTGR